MSNYVKAGYVYGGRLRDVTDIAAKQLNVINLAFGHCVDSRLEFDCSCADNVTRLREVNPELKILVSVGGWGAGGFSPMAATEANRSRFAESAVDIFRRARLDGIDIDWEYPCDSSAGIESSPDDKVNFTLMLKALRDALDKEKTPSGQRPMLTIAAGAGEYFINDTEMDKVAELLDYVSLMTYDMRGSWSHRSGHHTNLYKPCDDDPASVEHAVEIFHAAGVPLDKIVIGSAFYSRKWENVADKNHGYMQPCESTGGFGPSFSDLYENYIDKNGYVRYWDDVACAPYLYNGSTFISYDDEQSVAAKCEYVKAKSLRGIMYWEHSCDKTGRLLATIDSNL